MSSMPIPSRCWERSCKHYGGIAQSGNSEETEQHVCRAFPKGIPSEISQGDNPHTLPYPGDNGIHYEMGAVEEMPIPLKNQTGSARNAG